MTGVGRGATKQYQCEDNDRICVLLPECFSLNEQEDTNKNTEHESKTQIQPLNVILLAIISSSKCIGFIILD